VRIRGERGASERRLLHEGGVAGWDQYLSSRKSLEAEARVAGGKDHTLDSGHLKRKENRPSPKRREETEGNRGE